MGADREAIPDNVVALKEALAIERAKALKIAAELAVARAKASEDSALIAQQKLRIAKLERQIYGQRSERSSRLVDQLALTFEELEADATEDELAAERAVAGATTVHGFTRKRAERRIESSRAAVRAGASSSSACPKSQMPSLASAFVNRENSKAVLVGLRPR
jgi:transposase